MASECKFCGSGAHGSGCPHSPQAPTGSISGEQKRGGQ